MKTFVLVFIMLAFGYNGLGQTPRRLTKSDLTKIQINVERKAEKLKGSLRKISLSEDNLFVGFTIDTFKIEERQRLKLSIDYSTSGMVISTLDANKEYDVLLNKYYQLFLKNLNTEDQEILRKSQRNWIKFRDSECKLNEVLRNEYYSGGGTIQSVFSASRVLDLTKVRVVEFYHYLRRKMN